MISNLAFGQEENLLGNNKFKDEKVNKAFLTAILSEHPWTLIQIDTTYFDAEGSSTKVSKKHLLRIKSDETVKSTDNLFNRFIYNEETRDILFYNNNNNNEEYFVLSLTKIKGVYLMIIRKRKINPEDPITVSYALKQMRN
ncbi:hypothetical protein GU926_05055 [Nibribacter ruber]|uniref:Uncharacterized protein n=1 Tax=Nibribacter ruber TaxID=2698458 RepID=A0A6P1NXB3_9BACT|nr:hypothetical protein [Nibribacter ruber]QHL86839.1 hypothetical protein GU926_05055 [Nibribacter ruber]